MKKSTMTKALAVGAAMFVGQFASAATVTPCGVGSGLACIANLGTTYYPSNAGGGDPEAVVELAVADALSLASIDLTLLGKSDGGYGAAVSGQSGTWTTPDPVDYITVKASNSYIVYDAGGLMTGNWSTMGILNNGGRQPNVSHISYWSGPGSVSTVPLPATGLMLLAGLGGFAAAKRRKS